MSMEMLKEPPLEKEKEGIEEAPDFSKAEDIKDLIYMISDAGTLKSENVIDKETGEGQSYPVAFLGALVIHYCEGKEKNVNTITSTGGLREAVKRLVYKFWKEIREIGPLKLEVGRENLKVDGLGGRWKIVGFNFNTSKNTGWLRELYVENEKGERKSVAVHKFRGE